MTNLLKVNPCLFENRLKESRKFFGAKYCADIAEILYHDFTFVLSNAYELDIIEVSPNKMEL